MPNPKKQESAGNNYEPDIVSDEAMLRNLFQDELKDIYWAEKHIIKTLPKLQKAVTSEKLQQAFDEHLQQTQAHVERLEQIFELLGKKAQERKCDAVAEIIEACNGFLSVTEKGSAARDVGLILSAQKIEHYEIATYGGLAQLAATFGRDDIADLLEQTLEEKKETDARLTGIAESDVDYGSSWRRRTKKY